MFFVTASWRTAASHDAIAPDRTGIVSQCGNPHGPTAIVVDVVVAVVAVVPAAAVLLLDPQPALSEAAAAMAMIAHPEHRRLATTATVAPGGGYCPAP